MMKIDITQLPSPLVIEPLDYESILARRKTAFIELWPQAEQATWADTLELESEPVTKLLEESAYLEMLLRARINDAAKATMLAFARGSDLDHIGARYNTLRKHIQLADAKHIPPLPDIWESDDEYRVRIQMAFESLSVAGPKAAYEWHALSAHADICDASAISPEPGYVTIALLSRHGSGEAGTELINAAITAVNADTVRPIADRVSIKSAKIITYSVRANIYTYPEPAAQPLMQAIDKRLRAYINAQRRIGRDITVSGLMAALHADGVQRVDLYEPTQNIIIDNQSAAHCVNIDVKHVGTDE